MVTPIFLEGQFITMASLFHIHQGFFVLPGIPHQGGDVSAEFIRDVLGLPAKFHLCCGSVNIKIDLLKQCLQVKVASLNLHSLRKYVFVVTACYVVKLFFFSSGSDEVTVSWKGTNELFSILKR